MTDIEKPAHESVRWPAFVFISWLVLLTLLPFLIILGISLLERSNIGTLTSKITLENYIRCFNPLYLKVFGKTVMMAGGATLTCLLVGFPVAYYLAKSRGPMRNIGLILLFIPFWTNFILRVHGMISVFGSNGLLNHAWLGIIGSSWFNYIYVDLLNEFLGKAGPIELLYSRTGVYLGLLYNYLPFLVVPVFSSLEKFDSTLREAAWDLGANRFQTFWRVVIPNIKGGVIIGSVFVFIPMMGEYVIPSLLGGGKEAFLGNIMVEQFGQSQDWPFGSAIAGVLSMTLLLLIWLQSRWGESVKAMKMEAT